MKKYILAIILVITMTFSMIGCSNSGKLAGDDLATINGVHITKTEFDQYLAFVLSASGMTVDQATEEIKLSVLDNLVTMEVLSQAYKDKAAEIVPTEFDAEFETFKGQVESSEDAKKFFTDNNITFEYLKQAFTKQNYLSYFDGIVNEAVMAEKETARAGFEANKAKYEQIRASHILVEKEEEAKKARERVLAGEDFATLAKELSIDPSAATNGGDLDFFAKDGTMVAEFENAAFAMNVGDVSQPIKTQFGYHIIKLTDKKGASFDEVCVAGNDLYDTLYQRIYEEKLTAIEKDMDIDVVETLK